MDAAENLYLFGYCDPATDFDPSQGIYHTSGGAFVARLDTGANLVWAGAIGANYTLSPYDFKVDRSGNSYLAGGLANGATLDFDPGPGGKLHPH